jgi:hypothetical protein
MYQPASTWYGTAKNTAKDVMGRLNPLIKGPIEIAMGTQAYSGRNLLDLDSNVGRIISNLGLAKEPPKVSPLIDEILSNSPAARGLTTLRTLTDPAKGLGARLLNVMTGVKVTDVNMEQARNATIKESIEEVMRGKPGVHSMRPHLYVPKEERNKLDPADLMLMDLYRQQIAEAKRKAMAKKRLAPLLDMIQAGQSVGDLNVDRSLL